MNMKFLRIAALAVFSLAGAVQLNAQAGYEVPALSPDHAELATQVIDLQLSDPDAANKAFTKLVRKVKNNKEGLLSVGQFFLDKNIYPCANQCAKQLYEIAPTYVPGLMFNAEVCMLRKDYGAAGQKFDEVLAIDSTNVYALQRNAFVYKNINPHVAVELLEKIKSIEPNNYKADKELGDIAYNLEEYKKANEYYKGYFANVPVEERDVRSAENYLQSLYADQKFMEVGQLVTDFEQLDEQDMVFKRMKFFAAVENYELDTAAQAMSYITDNAYADSLYLYLDYIYAANLMKENGDIPAAIDYTKRALAKDATKVGGYKELSVLLSRSGETEEGLKMYRTYLDKLGEKAELKDFFGLGQQYVRAAQQEKDPAKHEALVKDGDAIFLEILDKKSDAYQAVLMRAALHIKDSSKPEAEPKAFYEQALQMMEGKEDTNNAKVQALSYLAFCAVQEEVKTPEEEKANHAKAANYAKQILEIDPENSLAKNIVAFVGAQ